MGFRYEFLKPRRLPERSRHRVAMSPVIDGWREPRIRSREFPCFALQLALRL